MCSSYCIGADKCIWHMNGLGPLICWNWMKVSHDIKQISCIKTVHVLALLTLLFNVQWHPYCFEGGWVRSVVIILEQSLILRLLVVQIRSSHKSPRNGKEYQEDAWGNFLCESMPFTLPHVSKNKLRLILWTAEVPPVEGTSVITGPKCNKSPKCNNIWS